LPALTGLLFLRSRQRMLSKLGANVCPFSPYFGAENSAKIAVSESHEIQF
jgi:hypothetical protein